MSHQIALLGLMALTHILCYAAMTERKYSVRKTALIYALYEAAGICFAVLHLCAGMVLNAVGIMNVWLSIVYYGVMLTIPLLGAGAMKQKRQEGVVSDKTTEEQTKKKIVT